jgi:hypothetical protein
VIRRATGITGRVDDYRIGLKELQTWVNGVNIMINNGLTSFFALWTDKEADNGFTNASSLAYNNIIENTATGEGAVSSSLSVTYINIALIIKKNIPLTSINSIQSLVLYNRVTNGTGNRTIGCAIELYNSINDPDLTEVLATTNVITSDVNTYIFYFPSFSVYTSGFVGVDSITNIVNETFALTEDAIFTDDYAFDITGDIVLAGDLTAENLIVGSTNLITEINAKQDTITTSTDLECKSLTTRKLEVDTTRFFNTIVLRRPTSITGEEGGFYLALSELQCWVIGSNLLQSTATTKFAIFAIFLLDKEVDLGALTGSPTNPTLIYMIISLLVSMIHIQKKITLTKIFL